jgi:hypothetical protein
MGHILKACAAALSCQEIVCKWRDELPGNPAQKSTDNGTRPQQHGKSTDNGKRPQQHQEEEEEEEEVEKEESLRS